MQSPWPSRQAAAVAQRLSGAVGTGYVSTAAGRNLAMWTKYRGLDPEISYQPPFLAA
jgi:hypothetical protein